MPKPRFDSEPLVMGAVGRTTEARVNRATEIAPELKVITRGQRVTLLSNRRLQTWRSNSGRGWYWSPLDRRVRPRSWKEVQNDAMAPGLAVLKDGEMLHNDLLGIHQLQYLEQDQAVYFSNWLPLLAEIAGASRTDVNAWASILLLGFPNPGRSQFEEIRSLPPCSSLRISDDVTQVDHASPFVAQDAKQLDSAVSALCASLPSLWKRGVYTLSGGWDSRFLVGLAVQRTGRIETWTTHTDTSDDVEVELARAVAIHLGTRHRELRPTPNSQAISIDRALTRFHQSTWLHSWLEPLASRVRGERRLVVDGLGGDVLFKGLLQEPDDDHSGRNKQARFALWQRLGGRSASREDVWSSSALALFKAVGYEDFDEVIAPLTESPTWQTLAILTTRTARAIALAPMRLFGPEIDVYIPFLTSRTLSIALNPSIHRLRGPALYRELLGRVDPMLSALPSTNDEAVKTATHGQRRMYARSTLEQLSATIGAVDPARRLLAPGLERAVVKGDVERLGAVMAYTGPNRALHGAYAYASWLLANPQVKNPSLVK